MAPRPADELTPRELAIRGLANGRPALVVANEIGVSEAAVAAVGAFFNTPRNLRSAALAIERGEGMWAGDIDDPDAASAEPVGPADPDDDCGSCGWALNTCVAEVLSEARRCCTDCTHREPVEVRADERSAAEAEEASRSAMAGARTLWVPQGTPDVTAVPAPHDRATLRTQLGRLVDADGTETVIGWAVVDVELTPDAPGIARRGKAPFGVFPVQWSARVEWTPEGVAAIRQLHAALPPEEA